MQNTFLHKQLWLLLPCAHIQADAGDFPTACPWSCDFDFELLTKMKAREHDNVKETRTALIPLVR